MVTYIMISLKGVTKNTQCTPQLHCHVIMGTLCLVPHQGLVRYQGIGMDKLQHAQEVN